MKIKTGNKQIDNLYIAVIDYIYKNGGSVSVIGGIELVEQELKYNYGIMIRITGKKPKFKKKI